MKGDRTARPTSTNDEIEMGMAKARHRKSVAPPSDGMESLGVKESRKGS